MARATLTAKQLTDLFYWPFFYTHIFCARRTRKGSQMCYWIATTSHPDLIHPHSFPSLSHFFPPLHQQQLICFVPSAEPACCGYEHLQLHHLYRTRTSSLCPSRSTQMSPTPFSVLGTSLAVTQLNYYNNKAIKKSDKHKRGVFCQHK